MLVETENLSLFVYRLLQHASTDNLGLVEKQGASHCDETKTKNKRIFMAYFLKQVTCLMTINRQMICTTQTQTFLTSIAEHVLALLSL